MRRAITFLTALGVVAVLLLASPGSAPAYEYSYARIVRLSLVSGDVQLSRSDSSKWEKAFANMPLQQGFTIGTNDGRAEIEFESGATAWLAENSVLQFTELALADGGRLTRVTLTQGTATFHVKLSGKDSFTVITPTLQVAIPRRSEFRVNAFSDGSSVSVFEGDANVSYAGSTTDVGKGRTLAYHSSASDPIRLDANPADDEWNRWVDSREGSLTTGTIQVAQYTDAPFQYGVADLTNYGGWNYYGGYGYGWQPWGISSGWAPFWNGQWLFYPGLGWTWVSYEPWGWVPYHFGQWVFSPAFGWIWIPGGYNSWCPAPVQWVRVGNRIGWTPLRPNPPLNAHPVAAPAEPRSPAGSLPAVPIVIGGKGGLGRGRPSSILMSDIPSHSPEILAAPPLPNGKFPSGSIGNSTAMRGPSATSSAGSVQARKAFQGGAPIIVPTAASLAQLASEKIIFDPTAHRFVSGGTLPVPTAPVAEVVNAAPAARPVPPPPAPIRLRQPSMSQPGMRDFPARQAPAHGTGLSAPSPSTGHPGSRQLSGPSMAAPPPAHTNSTAKPH